jgi:hypothetical protein
MFRIRHWIAIAATIGVALSSVSTALANPDPIRAALARAAQPPDAQKTLAAAQERLTLRLNELERFLARGGPDTTRGWSERLSLPQLRAAIASDNPDAAAVRDIEQCFYRNDPGLEVSRFLAVRESLGSYLAALEYAAAPSPAELYRQRLEQLEECLARLESQPTDADARQAGALVDWAAQLRPEGRQLAAAVRARYGRENAVAQISARMINELLKQDVQQSHYVSDVILGNLTQGPAYTSGKVSFGTIPSERAGVLEIRLDGLTWCPANIAQRGNIMVYSSANTSLHARKRVQMSDEGLTLSRAAAWCQTAARINDIQANWRFIERLAWRKAEQMLPDAQQEASRHAERQASAGLDQQGDAALGGINDFFRDQLRKPLLRLDALPDPWRFWTDREHLRMSLVQCSDSQLVTAGPAPDLSPYDLAIGGHESMINNFSEAALGGRVVRDEAWLNLMNTITGSQPRPLWVHDRTERWSVTFARERPIVAQFDEERIHLTLRIDGLTRGEEHFTHPIEIAAQFKPQITVEGPALVRDSELTIKFDNGVTAEDEMRQRQFLQRKFDAVLQPEIHFYGLVPPAGGQIGRLRALKLDRFDAQDGWFTLAYKMTAAAE